MMSKSSEARVALPLAPTLLAVVAALVTDPVRTATFAQSPPREIPHLQPMAPLSFGARIAAPVLVSPAAAASVVSSVRGGAAPAANFAWRPNPTQGMFAPVDYVFCLTTESQGCSPATAVVVREVPLAERSYSFAALPRALEGVSFYWTVGACTQAPRECAFAPSRSMTWFVPPDVAPQLLQPAQVARVPPNAALFRWTSVPEARSYILCVAPAHLPCPAPGTSSANVLTATSSGAGNTTIRVNLERFVDTAPQWTVAACSAPDLCIWQPARRTVRVAFDRALPELLRPVAAAVEDSTPYFEWTAVDWADFYLLCITRTVMSCPSEPWELGRHPDILVLRYATNRTGGDSVPISFGPPGPTPLRTSSGTFLRSANENPDLVQFANQVVYWGVAACTALYQGGPAASCRYVDERRRVSIRELWTVELTVPWLDVRSSGDNLSPGDWRLKLVSIQLRPLLVPVSPVPVPIPVPGGTLETEWPHGGSHDVSDGERVVPQLNIAHANVLPQDFFVLRIAAVDCDSSGIWTLGNAFNGLQGVVDTLIDWTQTCGGEEAHELSGTNDFVGHANAAISASKWRNRRNSLESVESEGGIGAGAFRATIGVTSYRQ
jgi:hypothetical protein